MAAAPVEHPAIPVLAERGGTQLRTPRPTALVDTREQHPFEFARFEGWFAGMERRALGIGDYSISGLEDICVVERKELADLVQSFTVAPDFYEAPQEDEHLSTQALGDHSRPQRGQIPVSVLTEQSQSRHASPDCGLCRMGRSLPLHGNS